MKHAFVAGSHDPTPSGSERAFHLDYAIGLPYPHSEARRLLE
jgi:hypothetical protein